MWPADHKLQYIKYAGKNSKKSSGVNFECSLTSFNILLDGLEKHMSKGKKTTWLNRKRLVADSINACNSDIVCLQEVNHKMLAELEPLVVCRSYIGFIGTTGRATHKKPFPMNNAILYDREKFEVLPMTVKYNMTNFATIAEPELVDSENCYDWRCVAIILKHKESGKSICVQTVHLPSGEDDSDEADRLGVLQNEVEYLFGLDCVKPSVDAHIVCGDFNSSATMTKYYENAVHPFMTKKKYIDLVKLATGGSSFNTYNDWVGACFDYVYLKTRTKNIGISAELPHHQNVASTPIPDKENGSDHVPLTVNIKF